MTHSTITSKGQTTLPAPIRKALHLKAGDRIVYELKGDSVVIRPQPGMRVNFVSAIGLVEEVFARSFVVAAIADEMVPSLPRFLSFRLA